MNIYLANEKDTTAILSILNEVTTHLHSKNIMQWEYPWQSVAIETDIKSQYQYIVKDKDNIAAVFSLKPMPDNLWNLDETGLYLYRIAVLPDYQGQKIGQFLCNYVKDYVKENGKRVYLDCWAGNEKLKNFYRAAGFRYLGDFSEEDYFISVFTYA